MEDDRIKAALDALTIAARKSGAVIEGRFELQPITSKFAGYAARVEITGQIHAKADNPVAKEDEEGKPYSIKSKRTNEVRGHDIIAHNDNDED